MQLDISSKHYIDTSQGIDISIPLKSGENTVRAWYCDEVKIEAVKANGFIGDVNEGGSVNFRNVAFNPHGNGTHTECVGHISKEFVSLNDGLKEFHFNALLISVKPDLVSIGKDEFDQVITRQMIETAYNNLLPQVSDTLSALIVRTLPNDENKCQKDYSNSNPTYFTADAMSLVVELGIRHFITDLPSVDREEDEGKLVAHHIFWNYPAQKFSKNTITELAFIPNSVIDGWYLLNLQITSLVNDASPSKPVLYKPITKK
ncbi:MAG: cyclase family protein [Crocinitomicaceae bacterium]|nr:cyclase family protein [Crocinitomicaceae bacterium]MBK8927486.1 cyclase family protein [Crocinitomicaceae bacterium]